MEGINGNRVIATGYGRKLFAESFPQANVSTITEIQAYALGARFLYPEAKTVLDIGGQDTKVISLSQTGKVLKFEMNDSCAAGTGKFLEFMATALQIPLESFREFCAPLGSPYTDQQHVHCFCRKRGDLPDGQGRTAGKHCDGIAHGNCSRTAAMLRRVGISAPAGFRGGVAHNPCVVRLLEEELGQPVTVPGNPDMVGALGAALHGVNMAISRIDF